MFEILFIVATLVVLLGVVFIWRLRKNEWKHEPDYRTMFNMGVIWLFFGIAMDFSAFLIIGISCLVIGIAHRKEWKEGLI